MKNNFVIIVVFSFLSILLANSQEILIPATYSTSEMAPNPYNSSKQKSNNYKPKSTHIKSLPFIDDFSNNSPFPDTTWWNNGLAYINSSYCINQPSIGVATLDALNDQGRLYVNASKPYFYADSLVSKYIDLSNKDSLFLSFYYQTGGYGDPAEDNDSLLLQFWNDRDSVFKTVWSAPDRPDSVFKMKMIPITDTSYLTKNFRFQFKILSSIYDSKEVAGKASNGDIWNIDYVYLDKSRTANDTIMNDVAIQEPLRSRLKDYERMPWSHYLLAIAQTIQTQKIINLTVRNNSNNTIEVSRNFLVTEKASEFTFPESDTIYSKILEPYSTHKVSTYINEPRNINNYYSYKNITFQLKAFLYHNYDSIAKNDTTTYDQVFEDYYAYDDGSAEYGYGISGNGADKAKVACRFVMQKEDTLQAVDIFFNQKVQLSEQRIALTVWNSINGLPDSEILKVDSLLLSNVDGINNFYRFFINPKKLMPKEFFIGWTQDKNEFLNIGFDVNRHAGNTFYLTGENWQASKLRGVVMIRPVVGSHNDLVSSIEQKNSSPKMKIVPNPFRDHISVSSIIPIQNSYFIELYDISGKLVKRELLDSHKRTIQTTDLKNGFYIYKIIGRQGVLSTGKLIKQ